MGQLKTFTELKRNLKKDFSGLLPMRVAVLGDSATQFLTQALCGSGFDSGLALEIWEAEFNQVERQVFDDSSELYAFGPEVVIVFQSSHKLLAKYNKSVKIQTTLAETELALIDDMYHAMTAKLKAKVIFYNYPEIDDAVFGNYANKLASSFLFQLRKLNYDLMNLASQHADLHVCDLSSVQNLYGRKNMFPASVYVSTEMVISIDVLPAVAERTVALLHAMQGGIKKCLILDLDNTLWGGVIGDDGLENIQVGSLGIGKAFTELQYWLKKLKERGIILAVCSKNTESIAKEAFENHPDMILRLDDIGVFIANWKNKADNIRQVQSILNIGFDSMVFLDDNPFERNIVKENIPGITVPELPEDPADFLEYLYSLNLFETVSLSEEDQKRTEQYQVEKKRNLLQKTFVDEDAFLQNLHMISKVEGFTKFNTPRVAQLSQRSNQFNLRTIRYSEDDIKNLSGSKDVYPFTFTLEDKFGDNGLVCVVILKKENDETLFIDTWFMSCRVLKRGMEQFVCNTIAAFAQKNAFDCIKGEFILTAKNELVKDHYTNLGFENENGYWLLKASKYLPKKTFISERV
ncbi:MAG: HAD-IIIC family phosphatase [Bacteroidota bacterium]